MSFPAFSFDSNSWYGNVDDAATFVTALRAHKDWYLPDVQMLERMLDCKVASFTRVYDAETCGSEESAVAANKTVLMEQKMMGSRPSFGSRREHYGNVKLREFLGESAIAEIRELLFPLVQ